MKKIIAPLLLSLLVVGWGSLCFSQEGESTAYDILSKYFEARQHGKFGEAYQYISKGDKAAKTKDEYIALQKEHKTKSAEFQQAVRDKTSIQIKFVRVAELRATGRVEIMSPDILTLSIATASSGEDGSKKDEEAQLQRMLEMLESGDFPKGTATLKVPLVKESDGWKVDLRGIEIDIHPSEEEFRIKSE